MHVCIVYEGKIPVYKYGGTGRDIWYEGKELVRRGHKVTYLVGNGSSCPFAEVKFFDAEAPLNAQIPPEADLVHMHHDLKEEPGKPYLVTQHGNCNDFREFPVNTVFVSQNHAERFGAEAFVYNGIDWDDYGPPDFESPRTYFHFLGMAAWRKKNVRGAIEVIRRTKNERLRVLGGYRLNLRMGFRFTLTPRAAFFGMVGGEKKMRLLRHSKGLIFPVLWPEPMGLAIVESLYFGCPVFGTPYGALPELVGPEYGYLSNDADELARAVEASDDYDRHKCHAYAREMFSAEAMTNKYLAYFEKVLNGEPLNPRTPQLQERIETKFLPWFD